MSFSQQQELFEDATGARDPARIGFINFTFSDPAISVTTEQRTVEHETIDDQIVVQTLGRKADQITISGVVPAYELEEVDNLTTLGVIELRSERWTGDVVVTSTSTDFKRAKTRNGNWLYDATIECLEVDENRPMEEILEDILDDPSDDLFDNFSFGFGP